ncbi:MAG TPA: DUF4097 family beta strand repeat-containing protein [Spirochaetia bacterium]|nr:DUF4097 family beta strand repeat-containing protein [Spirochaetia bacterium]
MKKNPVDILGIVFGLLSLAIVILSLVLLILGHRFSMGPWMAWADNRGVGGGGKVREEGQRRFDGKTIELNIRGVSGDITISGWEEDSVLVKYMKSAPSQPDLDNLDVEFDQRGNTLSIKPVTKTRLFQRGSISFEVFVPRDVTAIEAVSVSGDLRLVKIPDGVNQRLKTTSGRIETDNSASLDIESVSGSLSFKFSGETLSVKTVSGSIRGELRAIERNGSIQVSSVSGAVALHVFQGIGARVKFQSVSGTVSSDLPVTVTKSKKNQLEGSIGDGAVPFEIGTTSGEIKIAKL